MTTNSKETWDIREVSLLQRPNKTFTVIAISIGSLENTVKVVFNNLREYAGPAKDTHKNYGVATLLSLDWASYKSASYDEMNKTLKTLQAKTKNANLALLVLPDKNPTAYALFKIIVDRELGLNSLCITRRCVQKPVGKKMSNIILKLNLKATGVNHSTYKSAISRIMPDTLVLGADVTHPGTGAIPGSPSIAAIVGSVGDTGGRFLGSMRLQNQSRKEVSLLKFTGPRFY
jgi:eukaryotic translation initiation factor 2C